MLPALLISIFLAVAGCRSGAPGSAPNIFNAKARPFQAPGNDPWKLVWTDPKQNAPALLWNGLIGIRLGPSGSGYGSDGKPLPFLMINAYEKQGEEKIRPLAHPLLTRWSIWDTELRPGKDYTSTLDLRTGSLTTAWTQRVPGSQAKVEVTTTVHPDQRTVVQNWLVIGPDHAPFAFSAQVGPGAARLESGSSSNRFKLPTGERYQLHIQGREIDRREVTNLSDGIYWKARMWKGMMWARVVASVAPAGEKLPTAKTDAFDLHEQVTLASKRALTSAWRTDIEIDGPVEDQQAIRSWLFYLRSAIHPDADMSISPMGLSSSIYNGHVFWDADLWVFPALAFIEPEKAAKIPEYRTRMAERARENFREWVQAGRPTGRGKVDPKLSAGSDTAARMYPWESSLSGRETATGKSRFQHHITGTVAFMTDQAAALGLVAPQAAREAREEARGFYLSRIERCTDGKYSLLDTMSPDEFYLGDNDLYTNLLAQWCINGGNWKTTGPVTMMLPRDDQGFLNYEQDALRAYNQAAGVLAIYPLQYPAAEQEARQMMERFAPKVGKYGPAMSESVHALIWARLGERDKAYETWRKGWQEFAYPPHLLFSEKRAVDRTYFTTGGGGCLQTVIYGFLGFRIDSIKLSGAAWSKKLAGHRWLSIKPNLPKSWKKVTFRNFRVLGESYTLTATQDRVQVTKGDPINAERRSDR